MVVPSGAGRGVDLRPTDLGRTHRPSSRHHEKHCQTFAGSSRHRGDCHPLSGGRGAWTTALSPRLHCALMVQESRILQVCIFETIQRNLSTVDFGLVLSDIMLIADEVD